MLYWTHHSDQVLCLTVDLIGLFKKCSEQVNLCDDHITEMVEHLFTGAVLFYDLYDSGWLVNLHDDDIRMAVYCYI